MLQFLLVILVMLTQHGLEDHMDLPVNQILCTTNVNDVLKRFIDSGILEPQTTKPSVAPSMDIQIPSSLERLIYDFESDASSFYHES